MREADVSLGQREVMVMVMVVAAGCATEAPVSASSVTAEAELAGGEVEVPAAPEPAALEHGELARLDPLSALAPTAPDEDWSWVDADEDMRTNFGGAEVAVRIDAPMVPAPGEDEGAPAEGELVPGPVSMWIDVRFGDGSLRRAELPTGFDSCETFEPTVDLLGQPDEERWVLDLVLACSRGEDFRSVDIVEAVLLLDPPAGRAFVLWSGDSSQTTEFSLRYRDDWSLDAVEVRGGYLVVTHAEGSASMEPEDESWTVERSDEEVVLRLAIPPRP